MPKQDSVLNQICKNYHDDIDRLVQDTQNAYSYSKVVFIFERLTKTGPWGEGDFTMELILEIDMMQSALAVEYARVFSSGSRKVSESNVPPILKDVHREIMDLRNKRYAHDDNHGSVENTMDLLIEGKQIIIKTGANMRMVLGAPPRWGELIEWLGGYLRQQSQKQRQHLTDKTGYEWVEPMAPPTDPL